MIFFPPPPPFPPPPRPRDSLSPKLPLVYQISREMRKNGIKVPNAISSTFRISLLHLLRSLSSKSAQSRLATLFD
ncbi:hypothetical protein ACTXT7_016498 [Hymenolepis weldensis]